MSVTPALSAAAQQAVQRNEATVSLVVRLATRLWLLVSVWGWADTPWRVALLALCAAHDLWLWRRLRTHRPPRLAGRVVVDLLDAGVWSALGPVHYPHTAAVLVAIPLVAVLSARSLWQGLALAVLLVGGTGAVRLVEGKDPSWWVVSSFVLVGVLLGRLMVVIVSREVLRHQALVSRAAEAAAEAARLSGRNAVVTGIGADAIDQLQVTIFALGGAGVDDAVELRKAVAQHKQQLGRTTRAGAFYLRDACDVYSRATRSAEPDASRFVFFDVQSSAGTVVLSHAQARRLWHHLAALGLTGTVPVRDAVVGPTGEVGLDVGGRRVVLPAVDAQPLSLSVMSGGMAAMAAYVLVLALPHRMVAPGWLVLPLTLLLLVCAVAAHLALRRRGARLEPVVALGGGIPVLAIAALWWAGVGGHGPDDMVVTMPLTGWAMMLGLVLGPRRWVLACRGALLLGAVLAVVASEASLRFALAELVWPVVAYLGAQAVARGLRQATREVEEAAGERSRLATESARRSAAREELDYLDTVVRQGQELIRRAEAGEMRDAVAEDLARIRGVLASTAEAFA